MHGPSRRVHLETGFQSLFSWMTLIGLRSLVPIVAAAAVVSILVFLDDAHRQSPAPRFLASGSMVSILVFLDDAHRPPA